MSYEVGQILYVVFKNDNKVIPVQVIEEITRKTLEGLKVDYVLRVGSDKETTILFDEIDGDVFETPDIAISILSERAKKSIVRLVNSAVEKSKAWYKDIQQPAIQQKKESSVVAVTKTSSDAESEEIEEVKVKLPDGTYANVKFPMSA